jgi:pimeloyl-ACP methyl ester carboxylesterase
MKAANVLPAALAVLALLPAAAAGDGTCPIAGARSAATPDACFHDPDIALVSGTVFNDLSGDGRGGADLTEPPLAGRTVWFDLDEDGAVDPGEPSAVSADDGGYVVEIDRSQVLLDGLQPPLKLLTDGVHRKCTYPASCWHRELWVPGEAEIGRDFGEVSGGSVTGHVWEDTDADGVREHGEAPPRGSRVFLDATRDGEFDEGEISAAVDPEDGTYTFAVPPYLAGLQRPILPVPRRGWACTYPDPCQHLNVNIPSGGRTTGVDFGLNRPVVIFVPGFFGSEIACGERVLWGKYPFHLSDMRLDATGRSNLSEAEGGSVCNTFAAPSGVVVDKMLGTDVYGNAQRHLASLVAEPSRFAAYGWDWRKRPEEAVEGLDRLVERMRCQGEIGCTRRAQEQVVIVAHSMGGLVARHYIDDPERARKVSRLVTVATPYLGSAKALFPITSGAESALASSIDVITGNADFKAFAANMGGLYHLLPGPAYGGFLQVGKPGSLFLGPAEVASFVGSVGGNPMLVAESMNAHGRVLDHFRTNGVDFQVVVGEGVPTVSAVRVVDGVEDTLELTFAGGDGTVTAKSGEHSAPADRLHYICGVNHMPSSAAPQQTAMTDRFVIEGRKIPKRITECPAVGTTLEIVGLSIPGSGGKPARASAAKAPRIRVRASAAGDAKTLEEAQAAGLVDVIRFRGRTFVTTAGSAPVSFALDGGRYSVIASELDGSRRSNTRRYGPFTGRVDVAAGETVAISRAGREVRPAKADAQAPVTHARVKRLRGGRARVTLRARDASKIARTLVRTGRRTRAYRRPLTVSRSDLRRLRFGSVDVWGNAEKERRVR